MFNSLFFIIYLFLIPRKIFTISIEYSKGIVVQYTVLSIWSRKIENFFYLKCKESPNLNKMLLVQILIKIG